MFVQKLEIMRKIVIPTDFTVESLQLIEYAFLNFLDTKLDIVLVAGFKLPDTRWKIAHFREGKQIKNLLSEEFNEAKRIIELQHKEDIENINFELFTGVNLFAFQDFIEQCQVTDAIIPKNNSLHSSNRKWFDTTKFIKKNVKNVIEVPFELKRKVPPKKRSLAGIFNL